MVYNIQYKFKPKDTFPGPNKCEVCFDSTLTGYANELGVPCFVLQVWEGSGENARITSYWVVDKNTQKTIFQDPRPQVCEYILENISNELHKENEPVIESS